MTGWVEFGVHRDELDELTMKLVEEELQVLKEKGGLIRARWIQFLCHFHFRSCHSENNFPQQFSTQKKRRRGKIKVQ